MTRRTVLVIGLGLGTVVLAGLAAGIVVLEKRHASAAASPAASSAPTTQPNVPAGQGGSSVPALPVPGQTIAVGEPFTPAGSAAPSNPGFSTYVPPVTTPVPVTAPVLVPSQPAPVATPAPAWSTTNGNPWTYMPWLPDLKKDLGVVTTMPITPPADVLTPVSMPPAWTSAGVNSDPPPTRGEIRAERQ